RQRCRREPGEHRRREGVSLRVIADQLQSVDLLAREVDPRALLEEEAARKPAKRRLARDVLVVGADQAACHGPGADEAVEAPQRGVRLRGSLVAGHDGSLLSVLVRPLQLGSWPGVAVSSPCVREGSSWGITRLGFTGRTAGAAGAAQARTSPAFS